MDNIIIPTDEEDARINAGIALDEDNPELTGEKFAKLRQFTEVFPDLARAMKDER